MRIFIIVTIYEPDVKCSYNIKNFSEQSNYIIICDNSLLSYKWPFDYIDNWIYSFFNKNKGLSTTFNDVLIERNIDWEREDFKVFLIKTQLYLIII